MKGVYAMVVYERDKLYEVCQNNKRKLTTKLSDDVSVERPARAELPLGCEMSTTTFGTVITRLPPQIRRVLAAVNAHA